MIVDYRIYMCQFLRYLPYLYHNLQIIKEILFIHRNIFDLEYM